MTSRLLLIDGHSMAFRAFFALPVENFSTSTGQATNAVYGFTSMLINTLRDLRPDHLVVAFDLPGGTFRTVEYPEYKGTRDETPQPFIGQIELIQEVLDAVGVQHLTWPDYEADDIIATLARRGREGGHEVLISSGDRDSFQLVTDQVTVLYPVKGVSELRRMDPAAIEEKYGVPPWRYSDLAALVGETSDNLPGVPGVGPKTAAKWIGLYGDLAGIIEHADEIKGKAGESLRAHLDGVLRNRRLNRLVDDLPLPGTIEDLRLGEVRHDEVHRLFDVLQFRSLRDRLFAVVGEPVVAVEAVGEAAPATPVERLAGPAVAAWLAEHARETTAVHVEGRWARGSGSVEGVALATGDGATAWVSVDGQDDAGMRALTAWLADPARPKVLHDAKGPSNALAAAGAELRGLAGDTALAAYLDRPDQRDYSLETLVPRLLGRMLGEGEASGQAVQGQLALGDEPEVVPGDQAGERARAVLELHAVLTERLGPTGGLTLLHDLELPLVPVLAAMERTGIAVDDDRLRGLEKHFAELGAQASEAAFAEIGGPVNLSSPKQLQVVLFEQLKLPTTKKIKTGYTTDAEALQDLHARTGHPFLTHLLRHRDVTRLRQTVEGLLKSVAGDGRIHTTFQQTVAATGRLSSIDPNLQNIPVRTEEGRRIRACFVVGEGYDELLTADYSQIELRVMAHVSQDAGLIEAFRSGEDLHTYVGTRVFQVEPAEVTPAMRSKVKAMSYGLAYGLSAYGLSRQLAVSVDEANQLMTGYFERFGGVRDYLQRVVVDATRTGYTETLQGRRRYLPDLTSDQRQRREMAERMALNAPIQGSAADLVKVAMLAVEARLRRESLASRLLLQVHDELVVEVAPGERDAVEALLRDEMAGAADLTVPLDVHVGHGQTWHEAAH